MTTTIPSQQAIERRWLVVDAKHQVLGRLASRIALLLRGKHKPTFTPFLDTGDFVIVINAGKIRVTGNKLQRKTSQRYSGYPSGLKVQTLSTVLQRHPERVLREAVKGMMPDGPLGRRLLRKLRVYAGSTHPHGAQGPTPASDLIMGNRGTRGARG